MTNIEIVIQSYYRGDEIVEKVFYDRESNIEVTKNVSEDEIYYGVKTAVNGYYNEIKINTGVFYTPTDGWQFNLGNIDLIQQQSPAVYNYLMTLPGLLDEITTARRLGVNAWLGKDKKAALKDHRDVKLLYDKENNIQLTKSTYEDSVHYGVMTAVNGYYNQISINTGIGYSKEKGWEFNLYNVDMIKEQTPTIYEYLMLLPGLSDEINLARQLGVSSWFDKEKKAALAANGLAQSPQESEFHK